MQDFCLAMLEGKLVFPKIRGGAIPWMKRMVRVIARSKWKGPDGDRAS